MPGSLSHLAQRFFDVLLARPLTQSERDAVVFWLTPELAEVFLSQAHPDQRHSYHAALSVIDSGISDRDVIVAALLHDVGKRHARLGVMGRTVASLLMILGLPLTPRMQLYADHGINGARELSGLGAPSLAIDYALHHQRARPETIEPAVWRVLIDSDQPPKATTSWKAWITSAPT